MNDSMTTVSAYDILGVERNVQQKDIHAALRHLALAWHPDRVPSWRRGEATLRFQAIMDAYNKIRTAEGRKAYDAALGAQPGRKAFAVTNDNVPLATKARAWLKAIETVFWPVTRKG